MEPTWTKAIPNLAICNWFYTFFMINVIVMILLIIAIVYAFLGYTAKNKHISPTTFFLLFIQLIVAGTNTLFYYLICDRSLQPTTE